MWTPKRFQKHRDIWQQIPPHFLRPGRESLISRIKRDSSDSQNSRENTQLAENTGASTSPGFGVCVRALSVRVRQSLIRFRAGFWDREKRSGLLSSSQSELWSAVKLTAAGIASHQIRESVSGVPHADLC